jgi:hypothetical protein
MSDQALILLFIGAVVLVVVIRAIAKKQTREAENARRANETPGERYSRLHGAFRGERGSPGTSPRIVGRHSVNCECIICLYGHGPDNATGCRCKACSDPASVYGR